MGHKHQVALTEDVEITVGPEIITYRESYCSCGHYMGRSIVGRRPK